MLSATCSKLFWLERRFGEYDLHDLVELDQMTAGVMIAADAETCQILTNRNAVSLLSQVTLCMHVYQHVGGYQLSMQWIHFTSGAMHEANTELSVGVMQECSVPLSLRFIMRIGSGTAAFAFDSSSPWCTYPTCSWRPCWLETFSCNHSKITCKCFQLSRAEHESGPVLTPGVQFAAT